MSTYHIIAVSRVPFFLNIVARQFIDHSDAILSNNVVGDQIVQLSGKHCLHIVDAVRHDDTIALWSGDASSTSGRTDFLERQKLHGMLGFKDTGIVRACGEELDAASSG